MVFLIKNFFNQIFSALLFSFDLIKEKTKKREKIQGLTGYEKNEKKWLNLAINIFFLTGYEKTNDDYDALFFSGTELIQKWMKILKKKDRVQKKLSSIRLV